jgi:hypothetical protein
MNLQPPEHYKLLKMAHDYKSLVTPGLVVKADGSVYWMDVSDASYYIIEKLKIKVAKWGTPKKYLKKTISQSLKYQSSTRFSHRNESGVQNDIPLGNKKTCRNL